MIQNTADLIAAVQGGLRPEYVFFWGHQPHGERVGKQCLSQWYAAPFTVEGVTYLTAEHYMMAGKARLFGDTALLEQILAAPGPAEAKQLGRQVAHFDSSTWERERFALIVRGNLAKFGQHAQLRDFLLATKDKVLVEASPYDAIWGVGLAEADPAIHDPRKWKGLNLLGFALMVVREQLKD